jgi:hypothetical protein
MNNIHAVWSIIIRYRLPTSRTDIAYGDTGIISLGNGNEYYWPVISRLLLQVAPRPMPEPWRFADLIPLKGRGGRKLMYPFCSLLFCR